MLDKLMVSKDKCLNNDHGSSKLFNTTQKKKKLIQGQSETYKSSINTCVHYFIHFERNDNHYIQKTILSETWFIYGLICN